MGAGIGVLVVAAFAKDGAIAGVVVEDVDVDAPLLGGGGGDGLSGEAASLVPQSLARCCLDPQRRQRSPRFTPVHE